MANDPWSADCIKLTGKALYRIRQGKDRIVYEIEDKTLTVIIIKIGHRSNVYSD
ncbi:MAG: type II toxin-antitoxin system RelE/ParE family toxin [Burkholderiales bacterium]|nr:type II toxin-antitoxin system RelE/ParE family toxin [Burkholderiales bacterium]